MEIQTLTGRTATVIDPTGQKWPADAIVIYARDGDSIVGRSGIVSVPHVEGVWVEESRRGTGVLASVMIAAQNLAKNKGASKVFAFATSDTNADYLERLGYKKKHWTVWEKEI